MTQPAGPQRILIAHELGGGPRVQHRILAVAGALSAAGHAITLAVRNPQPLTEIAAQRGWTLLSASAWRAAPPPGFIASCYADLLLNFGFATQEALRDLAAGWRRIFERAQPDLILAEFAPSAVVAARLAGAKVATMGDGYTLPPRIAPMPTMRPYAEPPPTHMAQSEARALAAANAVLTAAGAAPLRALADLFDTAETFLCTFAEMDHYENRGAADYYGEVFMPEAGAAPDWPPGPAERVLVRLDPRHAALLPLLAALDGLGLPSVVHAPGLGADRARDLSRTAVRVMTEPLDRAAALQGCDFVVGEGLNEAAPALLASRPLLLFPTAVEQMLTLYRLNHQGLAHGLPPDSDAAAIAAGLRRLLDDAPCRRSVANFARSYAGYTPTLATRAVAAACGDLLEPG